MVCADGVDVMHREGDKEASCEQKNVKKPKGGAKKTRKCEKEAAKEGAKDTRSGAKRASGAAKDTREGIEAVENSKKRAKGAVENSEKRAKGAVENSEMGAKSGKKPVKRGKSRKSSLTDNCQEGFGRKKYDTEAALYDAVEGYFDSITYREQAREVIGCDKMGYYLYGDPLCNTKGEPIILLKYAEPPSVAALCLFIGVPRSTWYFWQDDDRFSLIIEGALTRIDAYRRQVAIEDGKRSRGAQFLISRSEDAAAARAQRKLDDVRTAEEAARSSGAVLSSEEKLRAIEDISRIIRGELVDLTGYRVASDEEDEDEA